MPFIPGAVAVGTAIGLSGTTAAVVGGAIVVTASIGLSVGLNYGVQAAFGKSSSKGSTLSGQTQMIRQSASPRRVIYGRTLVSGSLLYAEVTGPNNAFLDMIIVLAGHPVHSIGDVFFDGKISTDAQFFNNNVGVSFAAIVKHLGHDTNADRTLVALSNGLWTAAHKCLGCAYLYVRMGWDPNQKAFPGGIPNITAIVDGKEDIYDPRTGTYGYSNNWALCCANYLMTKGKLGFGADADEVDMTALTAAANLSDESVTIPDGSGGTTTQRRYTCDGSFLVDGTTPEEVMGKLLSAGAGTLSYSMGLYRLFGASYSTPTIAALTESDLRGKIEIKAKLPRSQLFNTVSGKFLDSAKFWQESDFPSVSSDDYIADDGGDVIPRDIELPFTSNVYACQRLAIIHLRKSRLGVSVVMPCKKSALRAVAWSVIPVSIAALGWENKTFRVTKLSFSSDGGIDLHLTEELASSYTWNHGDAITVDLPPETNLPKPWDLAAPTGLGVEAIIQRRADGSIYSLIRVTWTALADGFLDHYELGWKKTTETDWNSATVSRDATMYDIMNSVEGVDYDIALRAVNTIGVKSPWTTLTGSSAAKSTPPNPPTGLYLQDGLKQITASWNNPSDKDLKGVELWASTTNDRSAAIKQVFTASDHWVTTAPPGTYYAWCRAVDTTGNQSAWEPAGQFAGVVGVSVDEVGAGLVPMLPTWKNNFESDDLSLWTGSGGGTITASTDYYRGSSAGLVHTSDPDPFVSAVYINLPSSNLPTMAGNRVRVQLWAKQPASGAAATFSTLVGTSFGWGTPQTAAITSTWTQFGMLFDIPAGATFFRMLISSDGVGSVLVDNLIVFVLSPKIDAANIEQWIGSEAVGDAYIANLDATKITAGLLDAARINVGTITSEKLAMQIESTGFSSTDHTVQGWQIDRDGNIKLYGGSLEVRDNLGNLVLASNVPKGGLGTLAYSNGQAIGDISGAGALAALDEVTGTYIADLAVDTLKIAGEAVNVQRHDFSNSTQIAIAGAWKDVAKITAFPTSGLSDVALSMSVWVDIDTFVGLYRGATQIGYWASTIPGHNTTFFAVDSVPTAGTHDYVLKVYGATAGAYCYNAFLRAIECKR